MSAKFEPTPSQRQVIEFRGKNMLVSASAGTGKTATMIQRIVSLVREGADLSEMVVVTFTNLAAAEMKSRLADKLSDIHDDMHIAEQLDKLDTASICTLHSFCAELLRSYFYVADVDPSFAILDSVTVAALRKNALNDLFAEYFAKQDDLFRQVYKIFSTHRREDNFRNTLLRLYDFGRCLDDFDGWYAAKRHNFVDLADNNPVVQALSADIRQMLQYLADGWRHLAQRSADLQLPFADVCNANAEILSQPQPDLQAQLDFLFTLDTHPLPPKKRGAEVADFEQSVRSHAAQLKTEQKNLVKRYSDLCRGERLQTLWQEQALSVQHVDKLMELVRRFDELFWQEKKQRGGLDFNDLEHLTLKLLDDPETAADIRRRYKMIFVDEYQDTNPVQEAIISRLSHGDNLFMVGDVKQSIYGFRGCEPDIFVAKRNRYTICPNEGKTIELNANFRSNNQILQFVNNVFCGLMTEKFGNVDYENTAKLTGDLAPQLKTASVRVDLIKKVKKDKQQIDTLYDITAEQRSDDAVKQGELIVQRINEYVGMTYTDAKGEKRRINYGDVVILMRGMKERAADIYNTLVAHNIPVAANFKVEGYSNKEVRDLINLLRVLDNPYNDVYMVGACLTFGRLTEQDLVYIRLDTDGRIPFFERLRIYAEQGADGQIAQKTADFLRFLDKLRFYSHGVPVCETVLRVLEWTGYALSVQGLPNGGIRLGKLYAFVDSLRGASYAQSIDKFLSYVDETEEQPDAVQNNPDAVRMMTMHASKGLEFPVVIVAGLDSGFKFDKTALSANTQLGAAMDYYNLSTMRVAETLGSFACDLVNRRRQREEEMRLLYVAMTRAKFALDLVASVEDGQQTELPKLPTQAANHLDWLLRALYYKYQGPNNCGVTVEGIDFVEAQSGEGAKLCRQTVDEQQVRRKLQYVYPHLAETKLPSKVVSSALDGEYIDVAEDAPPQPSLAQDGDRNEVGTAYHKVYQYVPMGADFEQIKQCIEGLTRDGKLEPRFAERLDVQLIWDTLHNAQLLSLLDGRKVYHEIPFMLQAPYNQLCLDDSLPSDNVMLQGVIDLLALGDNSAAVIDFKYTSHPNQVRQRYRAQLNSYRMAVQRICGISDVQCYVLSIADNKLIKM